LASAVHTHPPGNRLLFRSRLSFVPLFFYTHTRFRLPSQQSSCPASRTGRLICSCALQLWSRVCYCTCIKTNHPHPPEICELTPPHLHTFFPLFLYSLHRLSVTDKSGPPVALRGLPCSVAAHLIAYRQDLALPIFHRTAFRRLFVPHQPRTPISTILPLWFAVNDLDAPGHFWLGHLIRAVSLDQATLLIPWNCTPPTHHEP